MVGGQNIIPFHCYIHRSAEREIGIYQSILLRLGLVWSGLTMVLVLVKLGLPTTPKERKSLLPTYFFPVPATIN